MRVPDTAVDKLIDAAVERAMPVLRELDALPLHPDERRLRGAAASCGPAC